MNVLKGTISKIEDKSFNEYKKNLVTIVLQNKKNAFVQFRGALKTISENYKPEDEVEISYFIDGKISKSGHPHNNLIANKISRI